MGFAIVSASITTQFGIISMQVPTPLSPCISAALTAKEQVLIGNPAAPITLIQGKVLIGILQQLIPQYTGKMSLIHRNIMRPDTRA